MCTDQRTKMHQLVKKNPLTYIQKVYGITPSSHPVQIHRLMQTCATLTGVTHKTVHQASSDFKHNSIVPEFVMQCCSAILASQQAAKDTISD